MPAITIQQAYALAKGAWVDATGEGDSATFNIFPNLATPDNLTHLLSGNTVDPEPVIGINGPSGIYTLVPATTIATANNQGPDYLFGGDYNGSGSIGNSERELHITGLGILKKLK